MKTCSTCGDEKTEEEFSWRNKTKGIRQYNCKSCHSGYLRDNYDPNKKRKKDLLDKYNLTEECWENLYLEQKGKCRICGRGGVKLVVDHCHTTGNVRGLLCHSCNMGLGKFYDDVRLLENAIQYLEVFVKERL